MDRANVSGNRIKEARKRANLDQVELAVALEVEYQVKITQSDISEIERGIRGVKDYELDYISRILNVDPTWLLRGNNNEI
ncbi:helix-turn-helix domain-containing protein [Mesobacillus maritimus]|uniref:Helix-turn-helix transcriptional regulator n=1 Tax=Mesobacillus maritimus TaxID=1643336 RepID=A0ABS7KB13_9BACI|nr:helix-turn-helix transcriptional regulator [Mesobacillus maritimus]MBY0099446.1 helix-turn-helix transcriptional regulator [Mesobacillus maritimus]